MIELEVIDLGSGILELENVGKTFHSERGQEITALEDIDLSIDEEEFVCILGPSGCGKSTLLRMMAGLEKPTSGTILALDKPVVNPIPEAQMVFQEYSLMPWRDVLSNVELGLEMRHVPKAERRKKAKEMLETFGLGDFTKSFPYELSGGMQQRVAIARAMATDPTILYMDEPFGALDANTRYRMQQELHSFWVSAPRTVVFVTHSVEEALFLGTRVLIMSGRPGKVIQDIKVRLPFPRNRWSPEFGELFQQVMENMGEDLGIPYQDADGFGGPPNPTRCTYGCC